jgi:hypothetical protein
VLRDELLMRGADLRRETVGQFRPIDELAAAPSARNSSPSDAFLPPTKATSAFDRSVSQRM